MRLSWLRKCWLTNAYFGLRLKVHPPAHPTQKKYLFSEAWRRGMDKWVVPTEHTKIPAQVYLKRGKSPIKKLFKTKIMTTKRFAHSQLEVFRSINTNEINLSTPY